MKKLGLTGGIGTGKTLVAEIFSSLGIPVFHADMEAKKAYSDDAVLEMIKSLITENVFDGDNINLIKLSDLVFSDKTALENLNKIIHPFVISRFETWIDENPHAPYIIMESAILFETGYDELFDKIVAVTAPKELCIERVMKRDGVTREMVVKRMLNQLSNEQKVEKSDFIIVNDNKKMLTPQAISIHKSLLKS